MINGVHHPLSWSNIILSGLYKKFPH